MRFSFSVVLALTATGAVVNLCGCGGGTAAPPILTATVDNYGGSAALRGVSTITATLVLTRYDEDGVARVSAPRVGIHPGTGWIEAAAGLPQGGWRAKVKLDGGASIRTSGSLRLSAEQKQQIGDTLRLILHRVRGPLNLLDGREKIGLIEPAPLAGYRLTRVATRGRAGLVEAYYFDDDAAELRFVAAGPAGQAGPGTVTILQNKRMPDGLMLPIALEVVRRGRNSLLGEQKILRARLTDVQVR